MSICSCKKNDFVLSVKDIHKSTERVWHFIDYMGAPLIILEMYVDSVNKMRLVCYLNCVKKGLRVNKS